jgi:SAM-dependent methyltransferase
VTEREVLAAALALGAAGAGGELSPRERRLSERAEKLDVDIPPLRAAILAGGDPLGEAFIAARPPAVRRAAGAFYTPPEIVEPMVAWALAHGPDHVVDPGCGSGRFAVAAARARPDLDVLAVDLDPLATLATRANVAVLGLDNVRVRCANFLNARLPLGPGRTAWVGNPPYVRHHQLTPATKRWAARAGRRLGHPISGLAGLHALFFAATALRARPGDVGCYVTSAEWLDVGYGSLVRSLLLNGLGGSALDLIDPRAIPFADAMTTALVTSFVVGSTPSGLALQQVASPAELQPGSGTAMPLEQLQATRWSPLFRTAATDPGELLGDLARVHRGVATGANAFFTMTKAEAAERGLIRWARPAITAAAEVLSSDGVIRDMPERRVIIELPPDVSDPAALAYLRAGERGGMQRRYLSRQRRPWWRLTLAAPPIVASYMARQAPRFALNPDGLVLLNVAHGVWPNPGVDAAALVERLNAARASFIGAGRTYHGGLEKFEPREMEALRVP